MTSATFALAMIVVVSAAVLSSAKTSVVELVATAVLVRSPGTALAGTV